MSSLSALSSASAVALGQLPPLHSPSPFHQFTQPLGQPSHQHHHPIAPAIPHEQHSLMSQKANLPSPTGFRGLGRRARMSSQNTTATENVNFNFGFPYEPPALAQHVSRSVEETDQMNNLAFLKSLLANTHPAVPELPVAAPVVTRSEPSIDSMLARSCNFNNFPHIIDNSSLASSYFPSNTSGYRPPAPFSTPIAVDSATQTSSQTVGTLDAFDSSFHAPLAPVRSLSAGVTHSASSSFLSTIVSSNSHFPGLPHPKNPFYPTPPPAANVNVNITHETHKRKHDQFPENAPSAGTRRKLLPTLDSRFCTDSQCVPLSASAFSLAAAGSAISSTVASTAVLSVGTLATARPIIGPQVVQAQPSLFRPFPLKPARDAAALDNEDLSETEPEAEEIEIDTKLEDTPALAVAPDPDDHLHAAKVAAKMEELKRERLAEKLRTSVQNGTLSAIGHPHDQLTASALAASFRLDHSLPIPMPMTIPLVGGASTIQAPAPLTLLSSMPLPLPPSLSALPLPPHTVALGAVPSPPPIPVLPLNGESGDSWHSKHPPSGLKMGDVVADFRFVLTKRIRTGGGCRAEIFAGDDYRPSASDQSYNNTTHVTTLSAYAQKYLVKVARWYSYPKIPPEIATLQRLRSQPYVVQMLGWDSGLRAVHGQNHESFHYYAIIEEMLQKGPMPRTLTECGVYAYLLIRAIRTCHNNGVLHRDIKPSNFFADLSAKRGTLLDFDCAYLLENDKFPSSNIGTPGFKAPEVLRKQMYTHAADIWGAGVTIAAAIVQRTVEDITEDGKEHRKNYEVGARRVRKVLLEGLKNCPLIRSSPERGYEAFALVRRMLRMRPEKRPTTAELLRDPFIAPHVWHDQKTRAAASSSNSASSSASLPLPTPAASPIALSVAEGAGAAPAESMDQPMAPADSEGRAQ